MAKIILLGSSGFVGRHLLEKLLEEKFQVKSLIHNTKPVLESDHFFGDILDPNLLDKVLEDGDIVVNLVGQINDTPKLIDDNVIGSLNILNSCIKKREIRIIMISSISIYGENTESLSKENDIPKPKTTYGVIKFATEKICEHYSKNYGLDVTVLRLATLYGPYKKSGFIVELIKSIKTKKVSIVFNDGKQIRDLLFVNDAITAIIHAIKKPQKGFVIFNIASGNQYSINKIINIIEKLSDKKLLVKQSSDIPDERRLCADNSKAKTILKWSPETDIETGLRITIEHFLDVEHKK